MKICKKQVIMHKRWVQMSCLYILSLHVGRFFFIKHIAYMNAICIFFLYYFMLAYKRFLCNSFVLHKQKEGFVLVDSRRIALKQVVKDSWNEKKNSFHNVQKINSRHIMLYVFYVVRNCVHLSIFRTVVFILYVAF